MMTYREAEAFIKKSYDQVIRLGLERMEVLLDKLGNPQEKLKFIHVAGTNGKGSVCAMTARILQCAGYQTGLFTSPVISDYREQFQIYGKMISKDDFARLAEMVKDACEQMDDPPSEFEKAVALAFLYFAERQCDLVVLEVGLGGIDDATNVIRTPEVAAIVNIDFDHMGFLGNTLVEIAQKKAGIIKEHATVVTTEQKPEVMAVLQERCTVMHATLIQTSAADIRVREKSLAGQCFDYENKCYKGSIRRQNITLPLLGDHQCENAAVVLAIIDRLIQKGYDISLDAIREGMKSVRWPGRFEVVLKDPLFIVDGAHNPDGIDALSHNLKEYCPGEKFIFITGILKDKDYNEMLSQMLPFADSFVTITPDNPRAMSAEECAQAIRACGFGGEVLVSTDTAQAVFEALCLTEKKHIGVCAFGSLYSVGKIKSAIEQNGLAFCDMPPGKSFRNCGGMEQF
ncbi:MAG: folylpolyglutamate synthase/dihydrofolate synthase family protein [Lachnospiraceae bacterium]|nr:bifunctional folylpolyglutamate synthase/dihydrofolate synthase [bacterium]MDY5517525.1 folylpolyglutamate synthase/dihydrofolate synthase family protein [Lachnospiraceae bacterium]